MGFKNWQFVLPEGGKIVRKHGREGPLICVKIKRVSLFGVMNIYNALIKSSLLYGSETWSRTENNKRRVEATEMDALRRSSRISRKDRIRNVTIRQQIGLEEPIIKEIEQKQLTWYGHV